MARWTADRPPGKNRRYNFVLLLRRPLAVRGRNFSEFRRFFILFLSRFFIVRRRGADNNFFRKTHSRRGYLAAGGERADANVLSRAEREQRDGNGARRRTDNGTARRRRRSTRYCWTRVRFAGPAPALLERQRGCVTPPQLPRRRRL